MTEPYDDESIMRQVQRGRVDRLAVLFERYHRAMYGFFVNATSDPAASQDLVQDVFERIIRYAASYDAARPFKPWLYRIARNALVDLQRTLPPTSDEPFPAVAEEEDDPLERREETESLRRALFRLAPDRRELLALSHITDLTYPEIAAIYGITVNAARVRVFRALRELKSVYRGDRP
jgi:RNA polymerase sigma-70 factor (ECF subfamily)